MNDGHPVSVGIHHVTAIAGDPQRNVDFYVGVLGLRLVKTTVNFDDPGTYHLYYGDETGRPGTIMTFFPWPGARRGERGAGETTATAFAVPPGSLDWWSDRLADAGAGQGARETRFGQEVLTIADPDGATLDLVADETADPTIGRAEGPVPEAYAIRGFHGITLTERRAEDTVDVVGEQLGWTVVAEDGPRIRIAAPGSAAGRFLDLLILPDAPRARPGAGSVHHVAFRAEDGGAQARVRRSVVARGLSVSPVLDRQYFRSIYFREPGGVLFEIATDEPGFAVDEPIAALGESLRLPPWLENRRPDIERRLPELRVPEPSAVQSGTSGGGP